MRSSKEAFIGDTVHLKNHIVEPLIGIKSPKPLVFSGLYPLDQSQFDAMRTAIEKLTLNDSGVSVTLDSRYIQRYHLTSHRLNNDIDIDAIHIIEHLLLLQRSSRTRVENRIFRLIAHGSFYAASRTRIWCTTYRDSA